MPDTQNAYISRITLPTGSTYHIKDEEARNQIAALTGGDAVVFIGVSTTELTDGGNQTPTVSDETKTPAAGQLFFYGTQEFIYGNDNKWHALGSLESLGSLAYKNSASGSFTPAGSVSQPTFSGSQSSVTITATDNSSGNYQPAGTISQPTFSNGTVTASGEFTPNGSVTVSTKTTSNKTATVAPAANGEATYIPTGSVAAPTISLASAGSTTTVNSITDVGTLPSWSGTVSNETLTISWSTGSLPTKGDNTTVKTGDAAYSASVPAFTGVGVRLMTGNIEVPATYEASFTGTEGNITVNGAATGVISQPTFTGTKVQLAGTTTAQGTVSQPSFTGTEGTVTVS